MERLKEEFLLFPDALPSIMKCAICLEIFKDPVSIRGKECQHVFCQECIVKSLAARPECPTCREEVKKTQNRWPLRGSQMMIGMLDEIWVRCPAKCGWTGRNDSCEVHLKTCLAAKAEKDRQAALTTFAAKQVRREFLETRIDSLKKELASLEQDLLDTQKECENADTEWTRAIGKHIALLKDVGPIKRPREPSASTTEDSQEKRACTPDGP